MEVLHQLQTDSGQLKERGIVYRVIPERPESCMLSVMLQLRAKGTCGFKRPDERCPIQALVHRFREVEPHLLKHVWSITH